MRAGKTLREIRNPLLGLPSAKGIEELDPAVRKALGALLRELGKDANVRAEESWTKGKGPMAAYWKAVGVYARHTARVVERGPEIPNRLDGPGGELAHLGAGGSVEAYRG